MRRPSEVLPVPETLPTRPLVGHGRESVGPHPLSNRPDVPPCEGRKCLRLLFVSLGQCLAIRAYGRAAVVSGPRVSQDVTALKVRPVAGLLKPEIVREVLAIVSHVESRDEHVGWTDPV